VILKPLFAANHAWAMARGLESLRARTAPPPHDRPARSGARGGTL